MRHLFNGIKIGSHLLKKMGAFIICNVRINNDIFSVLLSGTNLRR